MKILLPVAISYCGLLVAINSVFAQTWMQTSAPSNLWASIASSADGTKLVAVAGGFDGNGPGNGPIYTSTNSGTTWISNNAPNMPWFSVASSADGSTLAAVVNNGGIYTSTNSGTTWTQAANAPSKLWTSVVSSADGTKLAAVNSIGTIYTSTNSGINWSVAANAPNASWWGIASSADGSKLAAAYIVPFPGSIYTSIDSGNIWTQNNVSSGWTSIASSANGDNLAATSSLMIYTSTNSGANWISNNVIVGHWWSIASSADGSKLIAVGGGPPGNGNGETPTYGPIYSSTNFGNTWMSNSAPFTNWWSVASSTDGNKLAAVVDGGGIWVSQVKPSPQLNLTLSNTNLDFSWLVPSTNFVLQQNLDLTTANWVTLTNAPTLNLINLQNQIILSPTNNSGFFRLISQ
jgi:hypothetical protein